MIKLGVNVDHVATVRQARLISEPDPVIAAALAELAGADGITIHLREDRRHIQDRDLTLLRETVSTRLNLEMACSEEILKIAISVGPDQTTLVPENRQEITTEGGLNVLLEKDRITEIIKRLQAADICVSLFVDPDEEQLAASAETGADYIELHTGVYAEAKNLSQRNTALEALKSAAKIAHESGLGVNAGHGLNYQNVQAICRIPALEELNIGHSIVSRAVFVGLDRAVREMKNLINSA